MVRWSWIVLFLLLSWGIQDFFLIIIIFRFEIILIEIIEPKIQIFQEPPPGDSAQIHPGPIPVFTPAFSITTTEILIPEELELLRNFRIILKNPYPHQRKRRLVQVQINKNFLEVLFIKNIEISNLDYNRQQEL